MDDLKEMKIHVTTDKDVMTVLTGKALTPREKNPITISGIITSPGDYYEARKELIDTDHSYVLLNPNRNTITLLVGANDQLGDKIIGGLAVSKDLDALGINHEGKNYTLNALAQKLKFMRNYFTDSDKSAVLVSLLKSFKGKVHTEMEKSNDSRGNFVDHVTRTVDSNIPMEFVLKMPLYDGEKDKTFKVEICVSATDNDIEVWLESVDLAELFTTERKRLMDAQKDRFTDLLVITE